MNKIIMWVTAGLIAGLIPAALIAQTTPIVPLDTYLPITFNVEPAATPTPIPPTATSTATSTATPIPLTATPIPDSIYEFNIAVVGGCEPQAAGSWFDGKVYKDGNPANGYRVVFSFESDGSPVTAPAISGPHEGYLGWDTGYYSHIISAGRPRAGDWFVWIVDEDDNRISEIANFTTDGDANTCNQATVDFDSR